MGRSYKTGPRSQLAQSTGEFRESEREEFDTPPIALGRFVLAEKVPKTLGVSETLYEYRDRIAKLNKEKRGLTFTEGPLFVPLVNPDEFAAIIVGNTDRRSAMRRTLYDFRSAKNKIAGAFERIRKNDAELALRKLAVVEAMRQEQGDEYEENPLYLARDSRAYTNWGERVAGVRPQHRVTDAYALGFGIQLDVALDTANHEALDAVRSSGLSRGLLANPPSGRHVIDLLSTQVPFAETTVEERPIMPPPPAYIKLGPLVITELHDTF